MKKLHNFYPKKDYFNAFYYSEKLDNSEKSYIALVSVSKVYSN